MEGLSRHCEDMELGLWEEEEEEDKKEEEKEWGGGMGALTRCVGHRDTH